MNHISIYLECCKFLRSILYFISQHEMNGKIKAKRNPKIPSFKQNEKKKEKKIKRKRKTTRLAHLRL